MNNRAVDFEGFTDLEWINETLGEDKTDKLYRLIARLCEKSYRRGVQQTIVLLGKGSIDPWITDDDAYSYRFEKSLDISIGLDGFQTTSMERLDMEEHELSRVWQVSI